MCFRLQGRNRSSYSIGSLYYMISYWSLLCRVRYLCSVYAVLWSRMTHFEAMMLSLTKQVWSVWYDVVLCSVIDYYIAVFGVFFGWFLYFLMSMWYDVVYCILRWYFHATLFWFPWYAKFIILEPYVILCMRGRWLLKVLLQDKVDFEQSKDLIPFCVGKNHQVWWHWRPGWPAGCQELQGVAEESWPGLRIIWPRWQSTCLRNKPSRGRLQGPSVWWGSFANSSSRPWPT